MEFDKKDLESKLTFDLPQSSSMTIEYSDVFLDKIKEHFAIECDPTGEQIKLFVCESFNNAVQKLLDKKKK